MFRVAGSQESGIGVVAPKLDERDAPSQIAAVLEGPSVAKSPPAPARFGTQLARHKFLRWLCPRLFSLATEYGVEFWYFHL